MPLPMVHLGVGKKIVDAGFEIKSLSQFYLGSISPDAIHMRKNADRLAKKITHLGRSTTVGMNFTDESEDGYIKIMLDFVNRNKSKIDIDFLWGYVIHILTDMYWSKTVHNKFVEDYKKDTAPIQDERWAYYNDTDILDQVLFNECDWKDDVWQSLQRAEYFDFLDILSAQEIESWNKRTLHWFDSGESQHKNPVKYITKADIENFISFCSETIWNKIIKAGKKTFEEII